MQWMEWGDEAFARARETDRPILLSISAVWCHWCHVMDRTTYSDERVAQAIDEKYVPVRVDNDRRPDINARYNQGGWPTTAFLTPDGALLAGATYLPPEQMLGALEQIAEFYSSNRAAIEQRSMQIRAQANEAEPQERAEIDSAIPARVLEWIDERFDDEYAGFGTAPKFPMTDVLEFLLQHWRASGDQRTYDMLARTMLAMSSAGMYDRVEGGFFRYSTTRDWSVPHFEKMAEDHAALLRILSTLVRTTRNQQFSATLRSALHYVRTVLRNGDSPTFAGSQDADEEYYSLPLDERQARKAPYVDRTSYSNWTAALGAAFVTAGNTLEDPDIIAEGIATLDGLHESMRDGDGLLFHFVEPGKAPQVQGLLTDQAAYLRALLDAHEESGEPRFFERARELIQRIEAAFAAPQGGYYDRSGGDALGNLALPQRPMPDNASIAESLLRLDALGGGELRERAIGVLAAFAHDYERSGIFAAAYARAAERALSPAVTVRFAGGADATSDLREAARALPGPFLNLRTETSGKVAAYVCRGTICAAPVQLAQDVRSAYESITGTNEDVPIPNAVETGNA